MFINVIGYGVFLVVVIYLSFYVCKYCKFLLEMYKNISICTKQYSTRNRTDNPSKTKKKKL